METRMIRRAALVSLILMIYAPVAFARFDEEWGARSQERLEAKWDAVFKEVGLSEEQLKQIEHERGLRKEAREQMRAQLKDKREALRQALDAPKTDRAQIDTLVGELSVLATERIKTRVDSVLAIKEILTPEQFAQLRERKQEMSKSRRGKGPRGRRRGESSYDEAGI